MQNISVLKWTTTKKNFVILHNPIKRIFDIIFSLLVLTIGMPIYFIIALLVFISSPGPIFYKDIRLGRGGKKINCWKFRTMIKGADKILFNLLNKNTKLKKEYLKYNKLKNDPRVTTIGYFLRRTSLDELPQFYNVLIGDLSIVGPRPRPLNEAKKSYKHKFHKILSIRPGITGYLQVSGRSNHTMDKWLYYDEYYVDNHSFFFDLKIIFKTILIVFFPKGAY